MDLLMSLNALFFLFLGFLWKRDTMTNFTIKFVSWVLAATNIFFVLKLSGYVVQVH